MAGPVVHFVVLRTFEVRVNGHTNRYHEGKHYHARTGDAWDDLRSKIPKWERDKLVAVGLEASAEMLGGTSRAAVPLMRGKASVTTR